jgi:hypothetical protein
MSVRQKVTRQLTSGHLTADSPLTEVPGIGPYLAARLARATQSAPTIGEFWAATARRGTEGLVRLLYRALQNERGNQCVSTRILGDQTRYHVGDVNQAGYESCVALLDFQRLRRNVRYDELPRRLARSEASKECGCLPQNECHGRCIRVGGACVPRAHNSRGFVGVSPHPNQKEEAATEVERRRIRSRARTRQSNDPDAARDRAAGHNPQIEYVTRGRQMWRRPSRKVRIPLR